MMVNIQTLAGRAKAFAANSPRTTAALAICAAIGAVLAVHLVLLAMGEQSGLWLVRELMRGKLPDGTDSWNVMVRALAWLDENPGADGALYREIFFEQNHKFQYAPTSLMPLDLFRLFGIELTNDFLNSVNRLILIANVMGVGVLAWLLPGRLAGGLLDADGQRARLLVTVAAPVATLLFFPLIYAYNLGQLQVWISALFVGACIAWVMDRRALAGILIGLICCLKPQFGLFAIWGLLRREWNFTIALIATGSVGLLLSVILYGFWNHIAYLEVLSHLSRHGEAFWANQSANGLLQRLFDNGETRVFQADGFPPFHPVIYGLTYLVTLLLLAAVFTLRRREGKFTSFQDFMLAALAFTIASPIAWEHHYGVVVPMFAGLALIWAFGDEAGHRGTKPFWLALAFLVAAVPFWWMTSISGPIHILQSHLYFAALGLMLMLWQQAASGFVLPSRKGEAG